MTERKRDLIFLSLIFVLLFALPACRIKGGSSVGPHQTAETTGVITKTEGNQADSFKSKWRVTFQYTVDGKTYEGSTTFPERQGDRYKWVKGCPLIVCYDPQNPEDEVIRAFLPEEKPITFYPKCPPL